jgi:hypothetical protein
LDKTALSGIFGIEIEAASKATRGKGRAKKKGKTEKNRPAATGRRTAKNRKKP